MTQTDPAPAPFVFDRDYANHEQVRHLMPDYLTRYAELTAAGKFPYNSEFLTLPALATTTDRNRDTAIYLLQYLRQLDEEAAREADFLAGGGRILTATDFDTPTSLLRGTIVRRNFYVGGTGWHQYDQARIGHNGRDFYLLPKGARTRGIRISTNSHVLFRPEGTR